MPRQITRTLTLKKRLVIHHQPLHYQRPQPPSQALPQPSPAIFFPRPKFVQDRGYPTNKHPTNKRTIVKQKHQHDIPSTHIHPTHTLHSHLHYRSPLPHTPPPNHLPHLPQLQHPTPHTRQPPPRSRAPHHPLRNTTHTTRLPPYPPIHHHQHTTPPRHLQKRRHQHSTPLHRPKTHHRPSQKNRNP